MAHFTMIYSRPEMSDIKPYLYDKYFLIITHTFLSIAASSRGRPQDLPVRNGFLLEALDEMSTPPTKKSEMMQSSGK